MLLRRVVLLSLLTLSTAAMASTADLNLRNSSAQFRYSTPMSREDLGKTEFQFGALYSEYSNNNNTMLDAGIAVKDEIGSKAPGFSAGAGIKALGAHTVGTNESALAIGGMLRYSPPSLSRLGIMAQVYFSPNITTFGDADRYEQSEAQIEYAIIPNAAAYIGYRNIQFDLNTSGKSKTTLDEGAYIGVRMSF
jgi:hypothetical protein